MLEHVVYGLFRVSFPLVDRNQPHSWRVGGGRGFGYFVFHEHAVSGGVG
jgi:hypothetical protein